MAAPRQHLADGVGLAVLALERVLLVTVLVGSVRGIARAAERRDMLQDVLLGALQSLLVELLDRLEAELDVSEEIIGAAARKVLTADNTQHLEVVRLGGHGVGGDDPATSTEVGSEGKLVVLALVVSAVLARVFEAEGNEGQAAARLFRHDDEAELLETSSEVVSGADQVGHDGAVAVLAETDELVVLANDLRGTLGEVEGERGLLSTEVVDVEDQVLGEVVAVAPDGPADTGVDETVLECVNDEQ